MLAKLPYPMDDKYLQEVGGIYPGQAASNGVVSTTPEIYTDGQGWSLLTGAASDDAFGFSGNRWWYPRQWVTPTGSIFGISTEKMWEMQVNGVGSIRTIGNFKTAPNQFDVSNFPNTGPTSTGVMYDIGKTIQVGGNGYYNGYPTQSSNAATTFDTINIGTTGSVTVQEINPMINARQ
jgi:galactose oxidase